MTKSAWMWIAIVLLFLGLAGQAFYFYVWPMYINKKPITVSRTTPQVENNTQIGDLKKPDATVVTKVTDAGVTWIEPKKIEDLKLMKKYASTDPTSAVSTDNYYKIADLASGGEIILVQYQPDSPSNPYLLRFKKETVDGKVTYTYLAKNSSVSDYSGITEIVDGTKIVIDTVNSYQSITAPDFLESNKTTFKLAYGEGLISSLKNITELANTGYGKIYRVSTSADDQELAGRSYILKLADSTYEEYGLKYSFLTDSEVPLLTWKDGSKNEAKYTPEGYVGCGRAYSLNMVVSSKIESRLIETGKTNDGTTVYTVAVDDAIMKTAYDNYRVGRDKDFMLIDEFATKNPLFVYKSGIGDYIVFTNRAFGGLAECGKPVIYLYPEKTTNVSVKVGATITKSDPIYNNGWEVKAEPSGKLTVGGKNYPYLFWEGQGQSYPAVNSGTVVATSDVPKTIREQLAKLGLNEKEINDFVEFWLPKMPKNQFVRLTWFGTDDMNKLAPLSVEPRPDTMIRVFLDFEGLDKKIDIQPQNLSAPVRTGFTLVEWGGLLR